MKSLAALLAALIATTLFAATAEAGFKVRLGFGGPLPAFTAYGNSGGSSYGSKHCDKPAYRAAARRRQHENVRVSRKAAPEPKVAKVEEPVAAPAVEGAELENSSISTATKSAAVQTQTGEAKSAEATIPDTKKQVAAVKEDVGCKKFFPSVGMTLSVPCE